MKTILNVALVLAIAISLAACKNTQQSNTQSVGAETPNHKVSGEMAQKLLELMRANKVPLTSDGFENSELNFTFIECREGVQGTNLCVVKTANGETRLADQAAVDLANLLRATGIASDPLAETGKLTVVGRGGCYRKMNHVSGDEFSCEMLATKLNY